MVVAKNLGGKNINVGPIKGKLKVPRNILKIQFLYHHLIIHNIPECVANIEKMKVTHLVLCHHWVCLLKYAVLPQGFLNSVSEFQNKILAPVGRNLPLIY